MALFSGPLADADRVAPVMIYSFKELLVILPHVGKVAVEALRGARQG